MSRKSKIDRHPKRELIEDALINGTMTIDEICKTFSTELHPVTSSAIQWHKKTKLGPMVKKAKAVAQEQISEKIMTLQYSLIQILEHRIAQYMEAVKKGQPMSDRAAIDMMKLLATLKGETGLDAAVVVNFGYGSDKRKVNPKLKSPE